MQCPSVDKLQHIYIYQYINIEEIKSISVELKSRLIFTSYDDENAEAKLLLNWMIDNERDAKCNFLDNIHNCDQYTNKIYISQCYVCYVSLYL